MRFKKDSDRFLIFMRLVKDVSTLIFWNIPLVCALSLKRLQLVFGQALDEGGRY